MSTALIEQTHKLMVGKWESVSNETRPNAWGGTYFLKRYFNNTENIATAKLVFYTDDTYTHKNMTVIVSGPYKFIADSEIVEGAVKTDFHFDTLKVTPHTPEAVDILMGGRASDSKLKPWQVNQEQTITESTNEAVLGMKIGEYAEYDLVKVFDDMLYYGSRPSDGSAPDTEQKRATSLQVPLKKVSEFTE
jgi:Adenomatosis polyposis coli down-regulated 1